MRTKKETGQVALLLRIIDQAYNKKAWHGTNFRGSLRGVTAEDAVRRPAPGRHNIWELATHVAYWKFAVHRRLLGQKKRTFPLRGRDWFRSPDVASDAEWRDCIALLDRVHEELRTGIQRLSEKDLRRPSRGSRTRAEVLVYGIASHDLYHAGQIQLIRRLASTPV